MSNSKISLFSFLMAFLFCFHASAETATKSTKKAKDKTVNSTLVIIETSKGTIEAELWADKAPATVANFLKYADDKFYDNTIFHRVISNFMVQGGGMTADMKEKSTNAAIKNEASSELKNAKGTLAMARTMDINSATSQFFINLVDNDFLDHKGKTPQNYGYTVFGKVVKGMDVVEALGKVATKTVGSHQDVPAEPLMIKSIRKK